MVFLIMAIICIFVGFDKINHTYEIAEQRYNEYVRELPVNDDNIIDIPVFAEKYYISTNVKEIIAVYVCIFSFGMLLLLVLFVDFIRWVNTWEKAED